MISIEKTEVFMQCRVRDDRSPIDMNKSFDWVISILAIIMVILIHELAVLQ